MRSLLAIPMAIAVALLFVVGALILEPARWCVLYARPWWRRPALLDRLVPSVEGAPQN